MGRKKVPNQKRCLPPPPTNVDKLLPRCPAETTRRWRPEGMTTNTETPSHFRNILKERQRRNRINNDTNRDGLILETKAPIYVFAQRCQNWKITTKSDCHKFTLFFFDQPFPLAALGSLSTWASSKFSSQNLKWTTCVHGSVQVPGSKNELVKKKKNNTETWSQISSLHPVFDPHQFITVIRIYISVEGTCPQNTGISPLLV